LNLSNFCRQVTSRSPRHQWQEPSDSWLPYGTHVAYLRRCLAVPGDTEPFFLKVFSENPDVRFKSTMFCRVKDCKNANFLFAQIKTQFNRVLLFTAL